MKNLKHYLSSHPLQFDLLIIGVITLILVTIAVTHNAYENLVHILPKMESWQVDELLITMPVIAVALTVFSIRRWRELKREIREHRRTARNLVETHNILNQSPVAIFLWQNKEGWPVEYASENVASIFGYSAADFIAGRVAFANIVHPDDIERVGAEVTAASGNPEVWDFNHQPYRIVSRSGEIKWLGDNTTIRRDADGNITHYQGIVYDITERESMKRTAKKRMTVTGALADISAAFVRNTDINAAINEALARISQVCQAERTNLFQINEDGNNFINTHYWLAPGVPPEVGNIKVFPADIVRAAVSMLQCNESVMIPDTSVMPPEAVKERDFLINAGIRSLLGFPIYVDGELSGFFGAMNTTGDIGWNEYDRRILQVSAEIIGNALKKENLNETTKRQLLLTNTISGVSSCFVGLSDIDESINKSLTSIGRLCGASRAYLFLKEGGELYNTHEWCAPGVKPEIDNLQGIPDEALPWWMAKLYRNETIRIDNISALPPEASAERELLESQGIKSLLVLPVFISGTMSGFLGFDNTENTGAWNDDDYSVLRVTSETIGNALARRNMEFELQQKNEELDAQNEELITQSQQMLANQSELMQKSLELEEASRTKSRFLASMSHELRTPLNAIIGFSEIMADEIPGKLNEEQAQCCEDILNNGNHLLELINQVLDLSKIEAGKMEISRHPVDITGIVGEATNMVNPLFNKEGLNLRIDIGNSLPAVYADSNRVLQILLNLLSNAIKFTPRGGHIAVTARTNGDMVLIAVADDGIGIAEKDQERIFEAYVQTDTLPDQQPKGTGLGLQLCRQFIDMMGGQIWVDSQPGQGSTFYFNLPQAASIENETHNTTGNQSVKSSAIDSTAVITVDDYAAAEEVHQAWREGQHYCEINTAANAVITPVHPGI